MRTEEAGGGGVGGDGVTREIIFSGGRVLWRGVLFELSISACNTTQRQDAIAGN